MCRAEPPYNYEPRVNKEMAKVFLKKKEAEARLQAKKSLPKDEYELMLVFGNRHYGIENEKWRYLPR